VAQPLDKATVPYLSYHHNGKCQAFKVENFDTVDFPELIFGIAAPIGVDIPAICDSLANALRAVRYESALIHLTTEMMQFELRTPLVQKPTDSNFFTQVVYKIDYANSLCADTKDAATMARIGLRAIVQRRIELAGADDRLPRRPTAYIIRQLKRPDEVTLLRRVYGKHFILVSAYGSAEQRQKLLEEQIGRSVAPSVPRNEIACKSGELIARDANEEGEDFGQRLRETFHIADVFIDGLSRREIDDKLTRFIQAFFGRTDIAPSRKTNMGCTRQNRRP
jgi:hypothetical protein